MRFSKKQDGFTFIEILIAMAIFAIGFLAVASMQTRALTSTTSARILTEAVELASGHIEYLQGLPFDHYDLEETTHEIPGTDPSGKDRKSPVDGYGIQWEVEVDKPLEALNGRTVSKTIEVSVFRTSTPDKILAEIEMIKVIGRE